MSNPSAKPTGDEAAFWHVDDIDWTPVQRQQNADGTVSVVREKWPIMRPDFLSAYVCYEPGMVVRRHGHRSNHVVFVLGGGAWIGGVWSTAGTHIHVPLGAAFGPIVSGPEGVFCWELSFGEFGGWGDQPELYQREIESRGFTPLPDPPLDLGDWFRDPRGDWGADRSTPKVDDLAETYTVLADLPWSEVEQQHRTDGAAATRVKRPIDRPDFSSTYVEHDPGATAPRRDHRGLHLVWVMAGGAWFGDHWCPAGTHIEVPVGAAIGPIVAGDQGIAYLELTDGATRGAPDGDQRTDETTSTTP